MARFGCSWVFDCDGTYLANLTLEGLDSKTVWLCLPGASDYGRLKVNVSSGDSPREMYRELTSAESQHTEMSGDAPTSEQSCDACEMLTVQMSDSGGDGWPSGVSMITFMFSMSVPAACGNGTSS